MLQLFLQLAAVTLIFALVEKHLARQPRDGSKQDLEKTLKTAINSRVEGKIHSGAKEVSRFDSIAVLVASAVALLWVQSIWAKPFLIFALPPR